MKLTIIIIGYTKRKTNIFYEKKDKYTNCIFKFMYHILVFKYAVCISNFLVYICRYESSSAQSLHVAAYKVKITLTITNLR